MRCEDAQAAIQEALSGGGTTLEVAARLPLAAQRHLEGCMPCREAAHDLRALDVHLRAVLPAAPPPPPDLMARIMQRVEAAPAPLPTRAAPPAQGWTAVAVWLLTLGAAALLGAYGVLPAQDAIAAAFWRAVGVVAAPLQASASDAAAQAPAWMAQLQAGMAQVQTWTVQMPDGPVAQWLPLAGLCALAAWVGGLRAPRSE